MATSLTTWCQVLALLVGLGLPYFAHGQSCQITRSLDIPSYNFQVFSADQQKAIEVPVAADLVVRDVTTHMSPDRLVPLKVKRISGLDGGFQVESAQIEVRNCPGLVVEKPQNIIFRFNLDLDEERSGISFSKVYQPRWIFAKFSDSEQLTKTNSTLPVVLLPEGAVLAKIRFDSRRKLYIMQELRFDYYLSGRNRNLIWKTEVSGTVVNAAISKDVPALIWAHKLDSDFFTWEIDQIKTVELPTVLSETSAFSTDPINSSF